MPIKFKLYFNTDPKTKKPATTKRKIRFCLAVVYIVLIAVNYIAIRFFGDGNQYLLPLLTFLAMGFGSLAVVLEDGGNVVYFTYPIVAFGVALGCAYFMWGDEANRETVKNTIIFSVTGTVIFLSVLSNVKMISKEHRKRKICNFEVSAKYVQFTTQDKKNLVEHHDGLELEYDGNTYFLADEFTEKERRTHAYGEMIPININPDDPNQYYYKPKKLIPALWNIATKYGLLAIAFQFFYFISISGAVD